ncbi:glycosyltransferase [Methylocaldum sp.]|uniref:glycosyltransferase n=1 Tax=Methylocaldum sp. TaxID=1969727 RepID=UPI002D43F36E|nr:glycosyltransferase [Methylocaldum sp.]HYE36637.1 glycosyltransferase [Methylocaldum sp.]
MCQNDPVLIIDLAKFYGGTDVRVTALARMLHREHPYAVATLKGSALHQQLKSTELVLLPVPFSRGDPRILLYLYRMIREGGYAVVDVHNPQSQFWGGLAAIWAGARRRISTVHSTYGPEHGPTLKGRLYELVLHFNYWLGFHFVAVSESVYGYLCELGIPSARISLIHNGIDYTSDLLPGRNAPFFKELGWSAEEFVITVVARLESVKGHRFLFEALRRLAKERPRLRCLVVGDGRLRTEYEEQVKAADLQDVVHFAGFRNDIPVLLSGSDALCLPSLSEGLPYAVLEACNYRLPLLLSKVGGLAELFEHGKTAFLVPPADINSLETGISWLMDHPNDAAAIGEAAFQFVQQKFGTSEMFEKTLEIYQSGI